MSAPQWYAALFAVGAGSGITLFWLAALATGRSKRLLAGRTDGAFHVFAELVTGGLLVAGGVATFASPDVGSSKILFGLGAGALLYALSEAPGHYLRNGPRSIAAALFVTWPFALAAIAARFAG